MHEYIGEWIEGRMHTWMDGWMDGWKHKWMPAWMDELDFLNNILCQVFSMCDF